MKIKEHYVFVFLISFFSIFALQSDGVDRDSGGERGRRARAGRDIWSLSLPARASSDGTLTHLWSY